MLLLVWSHLKSHIMHFPAFGAKLPNCYINTILTRELNWLFWNKAHTVWVLLPTQNRFIIMYNLCTQRGSLVIQETERAKRLAGTTRNACFNIWINGFKTGRKHVVHCQLFQGSPDIATYFYHFIVSFRVVYILLKASTIESIDCMLTEIYNPHGCRKNTWKSKPKGSKPVNWKIWTFNIH